VESICRLESAEEAGICGVSADLVMRDSSHNIQRRMPCAGFVYSQVTLETVNVHADTADMLKSTLRYKEAAVHRKNCLKVPTVCRVIMLTSPR
jgi:hypothetical protein